MSLIFISLFFGFIGFYLGGLAGDEFFMILFTIIGILSPSVYVLDKLYKNANTKVSHEDIDETIEFLRDKEILTEDEYKKAVITLLKTRKNNHIKHKYNLGIIVLDSMLNEKIITENELLDKKKLLKNRLSQ